MSSCPVCDGKAVESLLELDGMPAYCNVLWPSRDQAVRAARGDIRLAFCGICGMIWNTAFDGRLLQYSVEYENSLHFSGVFQRYAEELVDRLIKRYGLRGKHVIDIGAGKGDFLALICERGGNRGVGFDPSYGGEADNANGNGALTFVRDVYSERYADYPADFASCRHVLEHIERPRVFLETVRRAAVRTGAVLYFEVPAAEYMLRHGGVWDVIYEHCSYFSAASLRRLFETTGFDVLDLGRAFGGQYLWLEARASHSGGVQVPSGEKRELRNLQALAAGFSRRVERTLDAWRAGFPRLLGEGGVAVWGAGSKGVTFLNLVGPASSASAVVDINPRKQGRHVAGTGHSVVAPDRLTRHPPRSILVMNPLYVNEVRELTAELGLTARIVEP